MGVFIRDVELVVGLSKKNIRYYEEMGLISPLRNEENDYRVYSEEDIEKLKLIKFLRELGVPIREIKMLNNHELSLGECMEERIMKINSEEEKFLKIKRMCNEIIKNNPSYDKINIEEYLVDMNILNKEGFTMRDVISNHGQKIRGAVISSAVFSLFFLVLVGMISYFQLTENEKMPWFIFFFVVILLLFPVFGIIYNLIVRIKEIKGGEEDEASKY